MLICGLKLTHDGAVALVEDDRMVVGVEVEKLENGYRYADLRGRALRDLSCSTCSVPCELAGCRRSS